MGLFKSEEPSNGELIILKGFVTRVKAIAVPKRYFIKESGLGDHGWNILNTLSKHLKFIETPLMYIPDICEKVPVSNCTKVMETARELCGAELYSGLSPIKVAACYVFLADKKINDGQVNLNKYTENGFNIKSTLNNLKHRKLK
jgi:hypothetical protein